MSEIIRSSIAVKRVFKKIPSQDGFEAELQNGEIVTVTDTRWNSDSKVLNDNGAIFSTTKGYDISFSTDQVDEIEIL
jgi:hypothetical protein